MNSPALRYIGCGVYAEKHKFLEKSNYLLNFAKPILNAQ